MKIMIRLPIEININGDMCGKCEGIKVIRPNPMSFHFVCYYNNDAKIGINRSNLDRCQDCLDAEKESGLKNEPELMSQDEVNHFMSGLDKPDKEGKNDVE